MSLGGGMEGDREKWSLTVTGLMLGISSSVFHWVTTSCCKGFLSPWLVAVFLSSDLYAYNNVSFLFSFFTVSVSLALCTYLILLFLSYFLYFVFLFLFLFFLDRLWETERQRQRQSKTDTLRGEALQHHSAALKFLCCLCDDLCSLRCLRNDQGLKPGCEHMMLLILFLNLLKKLFIR